MSTHDSELLHATKFPVDKQLGNTFCIWLGAKLKIALLRIMETCVISNTNCIIIWIKSDVTRVTSIGLLWCNAVATTRVTCWFASGDVIAIRNGETDARFIWFWEGGTSFVVMNSVFGAFKIETVCSKTCSVHVFRATEERNAWIWKIR